MRAGAVSTVALTLAMLISVAPNAEAGTKGRFRPVDQPTSDMVAALLPRSVSTRADVFDGAFVAPGDHPYVGLVLLMDPRTGDVTGQCTGSLIRPRYVLTAGHCTKRARGAAFIPNVVDLDDARPTDVFLASAIATAPRYSPRTLRDDVGLLKLSKPADIKPVKVASAADDERYLGGTAAKVVGWGAVDRRLTMPTRLRKGAIELLSAEQCSARWGRTFKPRSMICGGSEVTDTCVGDSGGPLLVRDAKEHWRLLGTTSFGRQACNPNLDSVYARVSAVRGWIARVTGLRRGSRRQAR
jgi:secreted trypsin-like serine protease